VHFRWRIFLANLDPVLGSEQGRTRPVVVISDEQINQILPVVNVLPLTTFKAGRRIYANEVLITSAKTGLPNDSLVLCYQIRTLDKKRLVKELGSIEDPGLQIAILDALKFQLAMDDQD
jgi:mRNA interferase MazF